MKDRNPMFLPVVFSMFRIRNIDLKNRTKLDFDQMTTFMKHHKYCDSCKSKICENRIDCSKFPELDELDPWDMGPDDEG